EWRIAIGEPANPYSLLTIRYSPLVEAPIGQPVSTMRRIVRVFWVILALLFLLEAWLWTRLQPIVAAIVAVLSLKIIKAKTAAAIEALLPAATLVVFLVLVATLLPVKIMAL